MYIFVLSHKLSNLHINKINKFLKIKIYLSSKNIDKNLFSNSMDSKDKINNQIIKIYKIIHNYIKLNIINRTHCMPSHHTVVEYSSIT